MQADASGLRGKPSSAALTGMGRTKKGGLADGDEAIAEFSRQRHYMESAVSLHKWKASKTAEQRMYENSRRMTENSRLLLELNSLRRDKASLSGQNHMLQAELDTKARTAAADHSIADTRPLTGSRKLCGTKSASDALLELRKPKSATTSRVGTGQPRGGGSTSSAEEDAAEAQLADPLFDPSGKFLHRRGKPKLPGKKRGVPGTLTTDLFVVLSYIGTVAACSAFGYGVCGSMHGRSRVKRAC